MKKKISRKKRSVSKKSSVVPRRDFRIDSKMLSVVLFFFSIFLFFLIIIPGENLWYYTHKFILGLFGLSSVFIAVFMCYISVMITLDHNPKRIKQVICIFSVSVLVISSTMYVFWKNLSYNQPYSQWVKYIIDCYKNSQLDLNSGLIGGLLGGLFVFAFGKTGARITNVLMFLLCIMLITRTTLNKLFSMFSKPAKAIKDKIQHVKIEYDDDVDRNFKIDIPIDNPPTRKCDSKAQNTNLNLKESVLESEDISKVTEKFLSRIKNNRIESEDEKINKELENSMVLTNSSNNDTYQFPPIDLLNKPCVIKEEDISSELNNNGHILVETLKSFNVQTKIVDISRGPAVTRYELQPASGVKISKITTLADDIALNLAAAGVRIEAPIPGKAAVGVEIPNKVISMVGIRELISSSTFKSSKSKLTVVLGRDISGAVTVADLSKMPHLLIAGSTGSGKSVCINSFIISLLYNAKPSEVKLLMIDPKVVELGIYNGIPHLLVPVVTDARKAAGALGWAVNEMVKRYKLFAENNVRDISSYNEFLESQVNDNEENEDIPQKMPQIVIIIDELSDLMMVAPHDVEDYICRLAQMARAAGMYLVIATQRPSVDVITGIIKANIPSRIALAVSSQIDSRTILDMSGAEKLLGRGDMLFSPAGSSKPIRVQGCYVTDKEIEKIIKHIKSSQTSEYDTTVANEIEKNSLRENSSSSEVQNDASMDPVIKKAIECVIETGQASISLLQRKLGVGYPRAGKLMDEMEKMGIVGPHEGSKPRQVLINYQQFLEMKINTNDN